MLCHVIFGKQEEGKGRAETTEGVHNGLSFGTSVIMAVLMNAHK